MTTFDRFDGFKVGQIWQSLDEENFWLILENFSHNHVACVCLNNGRLMTASNETQRSGKSYWKSFL